MDISRNLDRLVFFFSRYCIMSFVEINIEKSALLTIYVKAINLTMINIRIDFGLYKENNN